MARMIYRCRNTACRKIRAFEYPESRESYLGYGRYARIAYRVDQIRGNVDMGYDGTCDCGAYCDSNRVKGFVTDHVCDARCTSAKGPNCECSCGGKNHGRDYEIGVTVSGLPESINMGLGNA